MASTDEDIETAVDDFLVRVTRRAAAGIADRSDEVERLQTEVKALRSDIRELESVREFSDALQQALSAQHSGAALFLIDQSNRARKFLEERSPDDAASVLRLQETLAPRVDAVIADLANTLPKALEARGLTLDPSSRHPRYTLADAFIIVSVDRKRRVASLETRGTRKQKLPVDPDPLADAIQKAHERCFGRETDLQAFAQELRAAWEKAKKRGEPRVPISSVLEALRERESGFAVDEFIVDLARLVMSTGQGVAEAAGLHLDHTKDEGDGLLLPGLEQRGYFGYMTFEKEGSA